MTTISIKDSTSRAVKAQAKQEQRSISQMIELLVLEALAMRNEKRKEKEL